MTGRGIPDSNGCYDAKEFWIEYKKTSHWSVDLRPEQIAWILRRSRAGGRVFIAVRRVVSKKKRTPDADELYLILGAFARLAKDEGLRGVDSLIERGGPENWDWNRILDFILATHDNYHH